VVKEVVDMGEECYLEVEEDFVGYVDESEEVLRCRSKEEVRKEEVLIVL